MKTKNLFLMAAVAMMAAVSCSKDDPQPVVEDSISVDKAALEFDATGAPAQVVKVTANGEWTVTVDAQNPWVKAVPSNTSYDGTVSVTAEENKDTENARNGSFTLTRGTKSVTVTVSQKAAEKPSDPTKITTAAEFIAMLARPQSATCDTTYTIMNDIDFTGYSITPENSYKGEFYATLDGNGKKFTNYTATADMINKVCGTFKNLTVESGSFTLEPDHSCGIFCEQVFDGGTVENLVNKATITGSPSTTTTYHQGALCGICRGTMKNCKNYGNVTIDLTQGAKGNHYRFGGVAGSTTPTAKNTGKVIMENCENHGNIEIKCVNAVATTYLAGITGVADGKGGEFSISGCSNTGKLSITNAAGYESSTAKVYAGGLVGQRNEGDIKNCSNTGEVDVTALNVANVFAGGLVAFQKGGYSGAAFQNCTVNANVKASFLNETSTTANPLANAGMIVASVGDAGVCFGNVGEESIKVGGALYNGETKIAVTSANLSDLVIGSACTYAPTFCIKFIQ